MESIEKFVEIENRYNLYEKEAEGVRYWVYARYYIFSSVLMTIKHNLKPAHQYKTKKLSDKLRIGMSLFYYSFVKRYKIPENVDILISTHPRRGMAEDGCYECCYTTDIIQHYHNCCILEFPDRYEHKRPVREKGIVYTDRARVVSNLYYYFVKYICRKKYEKVKKKILQDVTIPLKEIKEAEQVKFDDDLVIAYLLKQIFNHKTREKYYDKIIRKAQPKVIVEVVSYAADCMVLNELGKRYHIPTVELQHGIMGGSHLAYYYGRAKNIIQFPSYVFLFSEYEKRIARMPVGADKIKAVGYPRYEQYLRSHYKPRTEKRGICFVSSCDTNDLSYLAVELNRRLDLGKWRLFYKLHPEEYQYWEDNYPWLLDTGIEVVDGKGKSLYEIFSLCEVQIGVSSTALFEGLGFGLNTLLYRKIHSALFQELCDQGYMAYVENADDCMEMLEKGCHQSVQDFWVQDALENMVHELDKIMEEGMTP